MTEKQSENKNPQETQDQSNREWKSSAFTTYFGTTERAAELYRALEQTEDVGPEDISFATLQGVLFMVRKNDMAFTVGKKILVIGEHQSTVNANMPLRSAIYYGRTMERLVPSKDIYKTGRIPIPTPEFFVFYNGQAPRPVEEILRLSDSYLEKTDAPMLELQVKVININLSAGHPILQRSRSMYEYSWFIQKIRELQKPGVSRDEAIRQAIKISLDAGIMVDFIKEHGSEVENMLFTEFNVDDALEVRYEEGMEKGLEKGMEKGEHTKLIQQVLRKLEKGKLPAEIAEDLDEDAAMIQQICQAAGQCGSEPNVEQIYQMITQ